MTFGRKTALGFLQELIRIDTVEGKPENNAPFGRGNRIALDRTMKLFGDLGYNRKDGDGYYGWGEKGAGALFGILGHLDVVPADGVWKYPPFSATVADGYLYGRGVLDDKGPMVAALSAFEELLAEGKTPTRRVRFIFGCNEESGWRCMERYAEGEEMPEEGISPDGDFPVIYAEKGVAYHTLGIKKPQILLSFHAGSRPNIVPDCAAAQVAFCEEIAAAAKRCGIDAEKIGSATAPRAETFEAEERFERTETHAATPNTVNRSNTATCTAKPSDNAAATTNKAADSVEAAANPNTATCNAEPWGKAEALCKEYGILNLTAYGRAAHGSRPSAGENAAVKLLAFLGAYDKDCAALAQKFAFPDGKNIGLAMRDGLSGALTVNLGVADIIGDNLVLTIDIRHPVTAKREAITAILAADPTWTVTAGAFHDPLYIDPDDPFVKTLGEAYAAVTGKSATPVAIGGATYARMLPRGVAFGPAEEGVPCPIHECNERISLVGFDRLIDIYKEAFRRLLFE